MKNSAIIIVDMQNEFCVEVCERNGFKIKTSIMSLIEPLNNIITYFRKNSLSVIWLNWGIIESDLLEMSKVQLEAFNSFEYRESILFKSEQNQGLKVLEKGSWSANIISGLTQENSDLYINKNRMSGFWNCDFDKILKKNNIEKLYFAGINTDQCVMATLQDAYFAGYEVALLKDCTLTSSPNFCFEAAIYNIDQCFGEVLESRDLK